MNHDNLGVANTFDNKVDTEQFNQVVEAILSGKYSWACVLMLRFAGYNPLDYIPYRTYNRLLKDNSQENVVNQQPQTNVEIAKESSVKKSDTNHSQNRLGKMKKLAYLEVIAQQKNQN
ncbi:MAG: HetP family heterocyst commitment protein [Nostocaceae cyanobacterium]|nr:HetP family heterocyst commitment protein [Nostocaceae cyanobacterium]